MGEKRIHTAIIGFNTTSTDLIDQTFRDPIIIQSIEVEGSLFTGDKTTIALSDQSFIQYGNFIEYFDLETKSLKITPAFGAVRVGICKITYEGARKIKSTFVGSSAQINLGIERGQAQLAEHGLTNVATAGTGVQLTTTKSKGVLIKGRSTNTGIIYVGGSTVSAANGYQLSAKEEVSLPLDMSTIYIDASVSGEGVTYIGWN